MKLKKPAIGLIVLALISLILITGSPFQISSYLDENNGHLNYKNLGQEAYAADDDGGGGDGGGGDDGGGDDGGGDDGGGDDGGDSEDSSSVGESFDDSSGSGNSEEGTSTSDDGSNNDADESDGGGVDSSASEFFSPSEIPTSTSKDGPSNADGGVDSPASDFFSASDEPTSKSGNSESNLRTLTNPLVEPTTETSASIANPNTKPNDGSPVEESTQKGDTPPSTLTELPKNFIPTITRPLDIERLDKDEKGKLSKYDVDVLCDASEDYEAHKGQCDKLYKNLKDGKDGKDRKKIHINHKVINKNKIEVRNYDNTQSQIIVVSDVNTCPTQTETVPLSGKLSPKGIRLLADVYPCKIKNGGVTLNIPDTQNIKLAALFMDKTSKNNYGILINPIKIQKISSNQALFTIQLDGEMTGKNPITGKSNTLTKINGLALYNTGANPINLNTGNMAALSTTLSK